MNHQLYILRRENRLQQKDLASILQVSRSAYQAKESGKYPFTIPEALKLAEYFGVTLDELFNAKPTIIARIKE